MPEAYAFRHFVFMKIEKIKISSIKNNPNNPRIIKDDKFDKLVKSIKQFPQMLDIRPIVVNADGIVLGGNMRLKACKEAGLKEVPVMFANDLNEEQQREFIIKDNIGFGEWDWEMINNDWNVDELDQWGLDVPDFTSKVLETKDDNYVIPDEIETDIILGDLFEIGQHRLLCGSSTDADAVTKLYNDCKPVLMITDPPYGVNYDPQWRNKLSVEHGIGVPNRATGKVQNDDSIDWTEAYSLFTGDVAYVWHAGKFTDIVLKNLKDCDFEPVSQIIWAKQHFVISRGNYHWQHEPCWYVVKKGKKHNWAGDRKQSTLWEILNNNSFGNSNKEEQTSHGTQKPVECMARPIRNNSYERDTVYDPFLGSGTTMVAAHQINRKCLGMEIDPKYCQVIVDRMIKLDPNIEIKRNGGIYKTGEKQVKHAIPQ